MTNSFFKPKYIIIAVLISVFLYFITGNDDSKSYIDEDKTESNFSTDSSNDKPPRFVLTEMNGRELEEPAYFTINYDNTLELKTGYGTIFKYVPTQHFGDDPLCNILATDNRGRNTAICIKKLTGVNVTVMLENKEMISNFKGYKK